MPYAPVPEHLTRLTELDAAWREPHLWLRLIDEYLIAAIRNNLTPLICINKIDLAPHVGASLEVMDRDARKMRGERPFVFTNLKSGQGLDQVVAFIEKQGMLRH